MITGGVALAVLAAGIWALSPAAETPNRQAAQDNPPVTPSSTPSKAPSTKAVRSTAAAAAVAKGRPSYRVIDSGSCEASYYWQGQQTASGERFDPSELTAAHKTLPMDAKVRVTNATNGKSVVVRINDRGPFVSGRCLDLSKAAMAAVEGTGSGVIPVRYQVLARA